MTPSKYCHENGIDGVKELSELIDNELSERTLYNHWKSKNKTFKSLVRGAKIETRTLQNYFENINYYKNKLSFEKDKNGEYVCSDTAMIFDALYYGADFFKRSKKEWMKDY